MLGIQGGNWENGDERHQGFDDNDHGALAPSLQIPKNRSTGNLASIAETSDTPQDRSRSRIRFSFDASAAAAEHDSLTRSPIMYDHDHGLGLSGLRRIRQQHNPTRAPSRNSSIGPISRSASLTIMADAHAHGQGIAPSPGPGSPVFAEDLSRFPSESLHSFSFAHQSEDLLHNRQTVLKRSMEFMKDRVGWSAASAGLASAQARAAGDVETQNVLDLLAKAQLVSAGNLPGGDPAVVHGPLSGPAVVSRENVFETEFAPRSESPDAIDRAALPSSAAGETDRPSLTGPRLDNGAGHQPPTGEVAESEGSSRTPTNESGLTAQSGTTAQTSPPVSRRPTGMKRTMTDTGHVSMHQKLVDIMARPFQTQEPGNTDRPAVSSDIHPFPPHSHLQTAPPAAHGHTTRWVPAAQAIFTTESKAPWTILAANDLACLLFGVTKAEVRKMGILEVVQEERRGWLERKLQRGSPGTASSGSENEIAEPAPVAGTAGLLGARGGGITAKLLSKPSSRSQTPKNGRRPATIHSGDPKPPKPGHHHHKNKSRGVLLCGDVVPIQKRNGATGSASLWVKEKRVGLIWVLEEIHEDVAMLGVDDEGAVTSLQGALGPIWGDEKLEPGIDVGILIPRIPRHGFDSRTGAIDYAQVAKLRYFTCRNSDKINIPATVDQVKGEKELRVSSFPHIAGIIVISPQTLTIQSSNSVFCGALFGRENPDGTSITNLVPNFDKILRTLTEEDGVELVDGIVVPEHSFRKASAFLALKEGRPDAATGFLHPDGLPARHRDGSELKIDVQMRVVKSEKQAQIPEEATVDCSDSESASSQAMVQVGVTEMVYALWITYSRHLHATRTNMGTATPMLSGTATPLRQPSPGQTPAHTPLEMHSDNEEPRKDDSVAPSLARQIKDAALMATAIITGGPKAPEASKEAAAAPPVKSTRKKTIDDFVILEEMGQGAYGQVKLARYRSDGRKCVLKYVTKRRILVDTWTRDRRLGTVPLEIHVLDFLRRDGLRHPNIVEMEDFFEDDVNYYIEMVPHGLPGMDLFDYIELRTNMDEQESRSIFVQVARAIHHLHTKALVVHRDIKDENVILDGEGRIKLIDFGSATYIKSGPFDVFVGTIDYAAPEVLAGKPYGGKEQDVWALGILLYTIIYKENPFYSIDEIMDRDLRVPYTISDESIGLIRGMLDRDVEKRFDIEQVLAHEWCQGV